MAFVESKTSDRYLSRVGGYRFNAEVGKTIRRDMDGLDYWPQVRQFTQPVFILHGRFDAIVAASNSWTLHGAIQHSRFYVFETAGHLPHVEQPGEFLRVVRDFLADVDSPR
jgi:pimeloyl-ACP methyl ester carboxylesterase